MVVNCTTYLWLRPRNVCEGISFNNTLHLYISAALLLCEGLEQDILLSLFLFYRWEMGLSHKFLIKTKDFDSGLSVLFTVVCCGVMGESAVPGFFSPFNVRDCCLSLREKYALFWAWFLPSTRMYKASLFESKQGYFEHVINCWGTRTSSKVTCERDERPVGHLCSSFAIGLGVFKESQLSVTLVVISLRYGRLCSGWWGPHGSL